jgi:hypothetical protein
MSPEGWVISNLKSFRLHQKNQIEATVEFLIVIGYVRVLHIRFSSLCIASYNGKLQGFKQIDTHLPKQLIIILSIAVKERTNL